jgi:hypothetical protein
MADIKIEHANTVNPDTKKLSKSEQNIEEKTIGKLPHHSIGAGVSGIKQKGSFVHSRSFHSYQEARAYMASLGPDVPYEIKFERDSSFSSANQKQDIYQVQVGPVVRLIN